MGFPKLVSCVGPKTQVQAHPDLALHFLFRLGSHLGLALDLNLNRAHTQLFSGGIYPKAQHFQPKTVQLRSKISLDCLEPTRIQKHDPVVGVYDIAYLVNRGCFVLVGV